MLKFVVLSARPCGWLVSVDFGFLDCDEFCDLLVGCDSA